MQTIELKDWASFEKRLQEIQQVEVSAGRTADFLFRGITDSSFPLATTLERRGREGVRICDYYRLIFNLKPQIESFTGMAWEIAKWPEVEEALQKYDTWSLHQFPEEAAYSYMIYLRHHGFPSPLLDWTRSPYIAAFFAFRSISQPREGKVSICVFSETSERFKLTSSGKPWIRRIGPYVKTHRRHFLQQSDYTMCADFKKVGGHCSEWHFARHEDVTLRDDMHQDVLWKFNIPWAERVKVLKTLDSYNLNEFSLFESLESLMETLAVREMGFGASG
jgi:hypothetical protein